MATRRRVKVPGVNGGAPGTAPRISAGVERGSSRGVNVPQLTPESVKNAREASRARAWATGNRENTTEGYPGNLPIGRTILPNSETIPGSRFYGNPVTENTEADLFSQSSARGDFIPLTYDPTKTAFPGNGWDHRRTVAAGYDRATGRLRVQFYTDGAVYDYGTEHPVPPQIAKLFRMADSPGRFINTTLNNYGYLKVSD